MKISTTLNNNIKKIAAILFWIAAWQICCIFIHNQTILPSPVQVAARLTELICLPGFWKATCFSCLRVLIGFLTGCIIGLIFGILTHVSKTAKYLISPLLTLIKATPVASFIILILIWLNNTVVPSFISLLIVVPIISANVYEAFENTDKNLAEAAQIFQLSLKKKMKVVYLPTLKGYLSAAMSTSLGFAFKSGIAAEVLCTPKMSVGKEIYDAKIYLETVDVFAWTAVIILLSIAFSRLLRFMRRKERA